MNTHYDLDIAFPPHILREGPFFDSPMYSSLFECLQRRRLRMRQARFCAALRKRPATSAGFDEQKLDSLSADPIANRSHLFRPALPPARTEKLGGSRRDVYAHRLGAAFHPGGRVDGVAEDVVHVLVGADDAGEDGEVASEQTAAGDAGGDRLDPVLCLDQRVLDFLDVLECHGFRAEEHALEAVEVETVPGRAGHRPVEGDEARPRVNREQQRGQVGVGHPGTRQEGLRQRQSCSHSVGIGPHLRMLTPRQSDPINNFLQAPSGSSGTIRGKDLKVGPSAEVIIKRRAFEDCSHFGESPASLAIDVETGDGNPPTGRPDHPQHHPYGRAFAGSVFPHERVDLPGVGSRIRERLIENYEGEENALQAIIDGDVAGLARSLSERQALSLVQYARGIKYGVKPDDLLATDEVLRVHQMLISRLAGYAHTEYARLKIATLFASSSVELLALNRKTAENAVKSARRVQGVGMDDLLGRIRPLREKPPMRIRERAVAVSSTCTGIRPKCFQKIGIKPSRIWLSNMMRITPSAARRNA